MHQRTPEITLATHAAADCSRPCAKGTLEHLGCCAKREEDPCCVMNTVPDLESDVIAVSLNLVVRILIASLLWISATWKAVLDKNAWDEDYNTRHPPDNFMAVKAKAKPQRCDEVANHLQDIPRGCRAGFISEGTAGVHTGLESCLQSRGRDTRRTSGRHLAPP